MNEIGEMNEKSEGKMSNPTSLNSDIFNEIMEVSFETEKLTNKISDLINSKRKELLGDILSGDILSDKEANAKSPDTSWATKLNTNQKNIVKKLLDIKDVINSI